MRDGITWGLCRHLAPGQLIPTGTIERWWIIEDGTLCTTIEKMGHGTNCTSPQFVRVAIAVPTAPYSGPPCKPPKWLPHDGGQCPVPGDTLVKVKVTNGYKSTDWTPAHKFHWHDPCITHYRIKRE